MNGATPILGPRGALGVQPAEQGRPATPNPWIGLWPCIFFLIVEFARPMHWFPFLKPIMLGKVAVLWGMAALFLVTRKRPLPATTKWILAFVALMAYQVIGAQNHMRAWEKLREMILPLVLGCLLPISVIPNGVAAMRILITALFVVHIPTAIYGLRTGGFGPGSWFGDQNDLAFALNTAIGIGCFLLLETRETKRRLWIAAGIGIMVATVIVSFSRGGFLGLAAVGFFLYVTAKQVRKTILVLILVAAVGILLFAPAEWKAEMGTISEADEATDTGGKRLYYWGLGWNMFLDYPVLGVGTENFGIRAPEYRDQERFKESMYGRVAHSLWFTLIPEHGTVGIFIYLGMLWAFFKGHRRVSRLQDERPDSQMRRTALMLTSGLVAGMAASLITGVFVSVLYYPPIWVLACLMGSVVDTTVREARAEDEAAAAAADNAATEAAT